MVKNRGLNFGVWRLGGGGREDVVMVTKFNPFFRTKLASFCHSRSRNIQAKGFTRCFGEHRRSLLTHHSSTQRSHSCPYSNIGQKTLHQWTSMTGQFGASWNTCISHRGWLVGFGKWKRQISLVGSPQWSTFSLGGTGKEAFATAGEALQQPSAQGLEGYFQIWDLLKI